MRLALSKSKGTIKVELRDKQGLLTSRVSSKFVQDKDFQKASHMLEVDVTLLKQAVDAFENGGPAEIDLTRLHTTIFMRPIHGSTILSFTGDSAIDSFAQALLAEPDMQEPILYWDDCSELAALDLDPIDGYEFDHTKLLILEGIPTPAYAWITKSGGLRLIYHSQDPFSAEEVAAVAYLTLRNLPHKSLEIKHDTRHPAYPSADGSRAGEVIHRPQEFDPAHLRRWLHMYNVNDEEVAEYLKQQNLQLGGLYEHSFCPVDPGHASHGKPVSVLDRGIYCFSCEARGIVGGSSKPGFFPYAYLCSNAGTSLLYRCMENCVHWEHARFIVESKLKLTGRYATLIYSAGMLLHSYDRKIVTRCFSAGTNFIRMSDRWTNLNGEAYTNDIRPILASLPSCTFGIKFIPNKPRIAEFNQPFDLSRYGYPSIKPIYGMRIWSHYLEDKDVSAVIQTRELSDDSAAKLRPRYIRSINHWEQLERSFPGVNRNFIKLLIAARGIVEGGISMPPFIFVTGPTGAGKSLSVFLAASICGDRNTEVVWTQNVDRTRQAIMDASGMYVTFNEVMKEAKGALQAMDFLLNLTPDSTSHYMYLGPMKMGRLPVIVLTDNELSLRIKQDAQLARRLVHVNLTDAVDWETPLKQQGIRHPSSYRLSSESAASTCNGIVSEVIDTFFKQPCTFYEVAEALGFNRLSDSSEAVEAKTALLALYKATCNAPDANGDVFCQGRGWKVVRRDHESLLQRAWLLICDENFVSSRRCAEQDWRKLIGAKEPVFFDIRMHGMNKVAIRFRDQSGTRVNEELM